MMDDQYLAARRYAKRLFGPEGAVHEEVVFGRGGNGFRAPSRIIRHVGVYFAGTLKIQSLGRGDTWSDAFASALK
jgi:hypothetical protein